MQSEGIPLWPEETRIASNRNRSKRIELNVVHRVRERSTRCRRNESYSDTWHLVSGVDLDRVCSPALGVRNRATVI